MAVPLPKLTIGEFLEWENAQETRHEFYRGEVFAMVGARRQHGLVVLNLGSASKAHLKGTCCRAFVESMKVQPAHDTIFDPDVFVTCDETDLRTDMVFRSPSLIVEVLNLGGRQFASVGRDAIMSALPEALTFELSRAEEAAARGH